MKFKFLSEGIFFSLNWDNFGLFEQIIIYSHKVKSSATKYDIISNRKVCVWKRIIYIEIKNKSLLEVFKDGTLTINEIFTVLLFVIQILNW